MVVKGSVWPSICACGRKKAAHRPRCRWCQPQLRINTDYDQVQKELDKTVDPEITAQDINISNEFIVKKIYVIVCPRCNGLDHLDGHIKLTGKCYQCGLKGTVYENGRSRENAQDDREGREEKTDPGIGPHPENKKADMPTPKTDNSDEYKHPYGTD